MLNKRSYSYVDVVASFMIIVICGILLIYFSLVSYNQYQSNKRILAAIESISSTFVSADYCTQQDLTQPTLVPSQQVFTDDATAVIQEDTEGSADQTLIGSQTDPLTPVEYSAAIAYIAKLQEVSSGNNASSILSLTYAVITTLILSYGTKVLRLGESDKKKLVQEISNDTRKEISSVESQLVVKKSIGNVITAINSTTSLIQLLLLNLSNGDQEALQSINVSFMECLSRTLIQFESVKREAAKQEYRYFVDISVIENPMAMLAQHFSIYKKTKLPRCVDDKSIATSTFEKIESLYSDLFKLVLSRSN